MKIKALISILILNIFFSANSVIAINQTPKIQLKGFINKTIKKGRRIDMLPETIFNTEFSMEGDYFSGIISPEDVGKLGVPYGSKLIGKVTKVSSAKSFNRDGEIEVQVGELVLPDGDTVKVDAEFESSPKKPLRHLSKKIVRGTAEVSAGAVVGAWDTLRYTGLPLAISTYGITVGAGAALGASLGLIGTGTKAGQETANSGFTSSTFKLKDDFVFLEELPEMSQELKAFTAETYGVKLKIKDITKMFSADFGDFLVFDLDIENKTPRSLFTSDFVLVSKKHINPIFNNPIISSTDSLKSIKSNRNETFRLAFSLAKVNKKDDYKLQIIDPITDQIVADFKMDLSRYL